MSGRVGVAQRRVFRRGGARPPTALIVAYIDAYRDRFGVEPICRVLTEHDLAIAPSTYYARRRQPVSAADLADAYLANRVYDLWRTHRGLYGAVKLWMALHRAGVPVGRDPVARLMKILGIAGVRRGRPARSPPARAPARRAARTTAAGTRS